MDSAIVEEIKKVISDMCEIKGRVSPSMSCPARDRLQINVDTVEEAMSITNNTLGQGPGELGTINVMTFMVPLLKAFLKVLERYGCLRILEVGAGNGTVQKFLMNLLMSRGVPIEWISTDLIKRSHAPDVVQMAGLDAVRFFTGFNVVLTMFPTPNDSWSTDVLKYLTDTKKDCAFIFGGETGYSDGDITILDILNNQWNQDFRNVFARVPPSTNDLTLQIIRQTMPQIAHIPDAYLLHIVSNSGTNEKAIELYFPRSGE